MAPRVRLWHLLSMTVDDIIAVEIDEAGRLCIQPGGQDFDFIYRAGMEVGWDAREKTRRENSGTLYLFLFGIPMESLMEAGG